MENAIASFRTFIMDKSSHLSYCGHWEIIAMPDYEPTSSICFVSTSAPLRGYCVFAKTSAKIPSIC